MFFWLGVYSKAEKISLSGGRYDSQRATPTLYAGFPLHPNIALRACSQRLNQCRSGSSISPRSSSSITPKHALADIGKHALGVDRRKRAAPSKAHNSAGYRAGEAVKTRSKEVVRPPHSAAFCASSATVPQVGAKRLVFTASERPILSPTWGCGFSIAPP